MWPASIEGESQTYVHVYMHVNTSYTYMVCCIACAVMGEKEENKLAKQLVLWLVLNMYSYYVLHIICYKELRNSD